MKIKHSGVSSTVATVLVLVVLVVGAGATYLYVSSTVTPATRTVTTGGATVTTGGGTVTTGGATVTTGGGTVTHTIITTSSSSSANLAIDPHPTTITQDSFGGGPQFVDPSIDYETAGSEVIQNVNEQLMFFKGADATDVVPWLASQQIVSADGLNYTYVLRQGIKFSDGTPFNASAVYFSVMRGLIVDDPSSPAWAIDQVLRGAADYSTSYNCGGCAYNQSQVDKLIAAQPVVIKNNYEVSFFLSHSYAAWPFIMAFSVTAVQDPTAVIKAWVQNATAATLPANAGGDGLPRGGVTAGDYQDVINAAQASTGVGTGPYTLTSWDKTTGDVTMSANPNYWGGPDGSIHPTIQTIIIKNVNDANTRDLDFKAGTADIAAISIANGQIFDFVNQTVWSTSHTIQNVYPGVSIKGPFASLETDFIAFNHYNPLMNDTRVREALAYLFDDATFANQVEKGFSPLATQIIPPGMFGYNPNIQGVPLNSTKALGLLKAAGADLGFSPSNPKTITIGYNTGSTGRQAAAVILASNVNKIASKTGLYANILTLPWPTYLHDVAHHTSIDVWFLGWIVDYVDPDDFLVPFASGTAGTYAIWSGFDNKTVDSWVSLQATQIDPTQRAATIDNIQKAINNQYQYIWTINGVDLNEARTWIQQKPNAYITSNIGSDYLTSLYFYYFASIQALTG